MDLLSAILNGVFGLIFNRRNNEANVAAMREANVANLQGIRETNEANLQAVRETNLANQQQADLAYQRSLPLQQVADFQRAGFSKSAAFQKLTGGGVYQVPTIQTATAQSGNVSPEHYDAPDLTAAFERLAGAPSSVMQLQMNREQLNSLRQEREIKQQAELRAQADEKRKQEIHEFEIWQKQYGKDAALKIDALADNIISMAADKNINLDNVDSLDKLVNTFNLKDNPLWKSMPHLARSQVRDAVLNQAAENRAMQNQKNEQRSSDDKHLLDMQQLKNLKDNAADFAAAKSAREKEYALRATRATLNNLAESRDLTLDVLAAKDLYYFDHKGNIVLDNGVPKLKHGGRSDPETFGKIRGFWNDLSNAIPLHVLKDLLRSLLHS